MKNIIPALENPLSWLLLLSGIASIILMLYSKFEINEDSASFTILAFGTQGALLLYMSYFVNKWLPIERPLPPPFNYFFSYSLALFIVSILFRIIHFPDDTPRTLATALLVPSFFFGVVQVVLRKVEGGWYLREKPVLIIGWIFLPLIEVLLAVSIGY